MIQINKVNTFKGHKDAIYTLHQGAEPWQFFSGSGDGMVVKWDLKNPDQGQLIANLPTSVYALQYIPNRNMLVIGQNYQGIHIIDLETNKEIGSLKFTDAAIFDLKLMDDYVLAATGDGTLFKIDLGTLTITKKSQNSTKSARCISINPHNSEIAVGYSDSYIRVFNGEDLQLDQEIEAHKNSVFSLSYHPLKPLLLSASRDAHLKIWDPNREYELVESIVAHMYAINHIEFSPSGHHFVTCSMDKSIKVWSSEEFQLLKVIDKSRYASHGTSVNKLYWSTYQNQLASCSDDRTISIWDLKI